MANEKKAQADQSDQVQSAPVAEEPQSESPSAVQSEPAGEAASGVELEQLQAALEAAQQAEADAKDQLLRTQAEAQNVRRRAEQDVEKAHKFALEKFAGELLPVVDSLERAVEAASAEDAGHKAILEGVELTLDMFLKALAKFNVEQIDPQGEPFDPAFHQAMTMVESAEAEPNSVMAVMQKGYRLNGRLVRPAMVVVAKGAPKIDEQA